MKTKKQKLLTCILNLFMLPFALYHVFVLDVFLLFNFKKHKNIQIQQKQRERFPLYYVVVSLVELPGLLFVCLLENCCCCYYQQTKVVFWKVKNNIATERIKHQQQHILLMDEKQFLLYIAEWKLQSHFNGTAEEAQEKKIKEKKRRKTESNVKEHNQYLHRNGKNKS